MLTLLASLAAAQPELPDDALLRPTYSVRDHSRYAAGTAFVVRHKGQTLMLSSYHLLGPERGVSSLVPGSRLDSLVQVDAWGLESRKRVVKAAAPQAWEHAGASDVGGDVLVVPLLLDEKGRAGGRQLPNPLPLGSECPEAGAQVWLAAELAWSADPDARLHPATVDSCDPQELALSFPPGNQFGDAEGAPILDASGQVVGVFSRALNGTQAVAVAPESIQAAILGRELPEIPVDLSGLDLQTLHGEWLMDWGIRGKREEEIVQALAIDPVLTELWAELSRLAWQDATGNFERINTQVERWNARYAEAGVDMVLSPVASGQQLVLLAHHVLARFQVDAGGGPTQVLLVERWEGSNVAAPLHATLESGEILVNAGEVRDRAVGLWPLIGSRPALDAELQAALGAEHFETLRSGAASRKAAQAAVDSVNGRTGCSRFGIYRVSPLGLDPRTLEVLEANVGTGRCPPVTPRELKALKAAAVAGEAFDALAAHLLAGVLLQAAAPERGDAIQAALSHGPSVQATRARLCQELQAGYPEAEGWDEERLCGRGELDFTPLDIQLPELPSALASPSEERALHSAD